MNINELNKQLKINYPNNDINVLKIKNEFFSSNYQKEAKLIKVNIDGVVVDRIIYNFGKGIF